MSKKEITMISLCHMEKDLDELSVEDLEQLRGGRTMFACTENSCTLDSGNCTENNCLAFTGNCTENGCTAFSGNCTENESWISDL